MTRMVTVFRNRLRPDALDEYGPVAAEMDALARSMPGFVDIKTFQADDGERVSVVVFDSEESHAAWRDHPRHREVQALGRERFYDEYRLQVCEEVRERRFEREP